MNISKLVVIFLTTIIIACGEPQQKIMPIDEMSWDGIVMQAKGTQVDFMMWQGSPKVNEYMNEFAAKRLNELYGIKLNLVGGQGPEIVQHIMGELEADVEEGSIDIVWINGETFYQLKKINGLYGPFTSSLPNIQYVDMTDPYISIDFQYEVDGMEAPWSITQFALVYDSLDVQNPPKSLNELSAFVKEHPGTFTISYDFSGMTLLKSMLAELAGGSKSLNGLFDQDLYDKNSERLWNWINDHRSYFWKGGRTFPKEHSKLKQMFGSGELKLAYGFGEGGIDDAVNQGIYRPSTKAYAWSTGTIKNTNYLGIPYNADNKAGALVAINFLLSPEAQFKKADPEQMDANIVLDPTKLKDEDKLRLKQIPKRKYGPSLVELSSSAMQEPDAQYMIRLFDDFKTNVIDK